MSKTIPPNTKPYYDADGRLIDFLPDSKCARYLALGIARAVRSRGEVVRLYRVTRERSFGSARQAIAQLSSGSSTTVRLRNENGIVIAPPWTREHRPQHQTKL